MCGFSSRPPQLPERGGRVASNLSALPLPILPDWPGRVPDLPGAFARGGGGDDATAPI